MEVLAIGDNCIDVYLDQGAGYPGGGPVNTAAYLSRVGVKVAYAGAVGEDPSGRLLLSSLVEEGVDTSWVQVLPGLTNLAFVRHVNHDRTFVGARAGVRSQFRWQQIPMSVCTSARVVHTTVYGGVNDLLPHLSKRKVLVTYDFSREFSPEHYDLLPFVGVAFASAAHLTELETLEVAEDLLDHGASTAVLTRGEHGSLAVTRGVTAKCDALNVHVVDTLGSGDAFIAGYIHGLLRDEPIRSCLERGRDMAAESLQSFGAYGHGMDLEALGLASDVLPWK